MSYPEPDRSDFEPNFAKTGENPAVDVGWARGTLSDGRPFRAECWAEGGATYLTLFFSRAGLENATAEAVGVLLEGEGLLSFTSERRPVSARPYTDASGNDLLTVTVVVGSEGDLLAKDSLDLRPYEG